MSGWAEARRVLAMRLLTVDDVSSTAPALAALRGRDRHVTVLASPAGAEAARFIPMVDEVIVDAARQTTVPEPDDAAPDRALVETLRRGDFDGVAIFTAPGRSPLPAALMCHLAGIPLRLARWRENPRRLLTDWVRKGDDALGLEHEARRRLGLVASVGFDELDPAPRIVPPTEAVAGVDALLRFLGLAHGGPWAVVHLGGGAGSRRRQAEELTRVACILAERHGWRVLVTGTDEEHELAAHVATSPGSISLAGRLDLAGLAALIARAPVVVTDGTGPAHLAVALGTPVIELHAPTGPRRPPPHARDHGPLRGTRPEGHRRWPIGTSPEIVAEAARRAAAGRASDIRGEPTPA